MLSQILQVECIGQTKRISKVEEPWWLRFSSIALWSQEARTLLLAWSRTSPSPGISWPWTWFSIYYSCLFPEARWSSRECSSAWCTIGRSRSEFAHTVCRSSSSRSLFGSRELQPGEPNSRRLFSARSALPCLPLSLATSGRCLTNQGEENPGDTTTLVWIELSLEETDRYPGLA